MMTEYQKDILVGAVFIAGTLSIIFWSIHYHGNAASRSRLFQYYTSLPSSRKLMIPYKPTPPRDIVYTLNA